MSGSLFQIHAAVDGVSVHEAVESLFPAPELSSKIIGQSATLRQINKQVEIVAPTDATVLILGETRNEISVDFAESEIDLSRRSPSPFSDYQQQHVVLVLSALIRLRRDLQADNDAGSTPCAGFDLQLSSKLLDPRTHISHSKASGLFETTPAHPGSIVCDLES